MTKNVLILSFIGFFLLGSFSSFGQKHNQNDISFIQDEKNLKIDQPSASINLDRKPFSIKYFCNYYNSKKEHFHAAQIAVLEDPKDTFLLKIGQNLTDIPFFEPGSGMASDEDGTYNSIYITNKGHHYLYYENEKNKRVNVVLSKNGLLELEWKINVAYYDDKIISFSDLKLSHLFFAILIDRNLNGKIDSDELKTVQINLNQ